MADPTSLLAPRPDLEPDPSAGAYGDIDDVLDGLKAARTRWREANWRNAEHGAAGFPSRHDLAKTAEQLIGTLFPLRLGPSFVRRHNEDAFVEQALRTALSRIYGQIRLELAYTRSADEGWVADDAHRIEIDREAARIIDAFARALPDIRRQLDLDVEAAFAADRAARSVDEVLICYPGIVAIIHYRLAHSLHRLGAPLVARIITEAAHSKTGIDIHPGAAIGKGLFIDHGTGVVIGETAIVGDRVRLHQSVTLGAAGRPSAEDDALWRGTPRHPIVEDDVILYPGATLLGRIRIGRGSVIGGNVWLTESVPAGSHVEQGAVRHRRVAADDNPPDDVLLTG